MAAVYEPIVRAKPGEIEALGRLSPFAKANSQPILDISWVDTETATQLQERLTDIAVKVSEGWGTANPIYFDFSLFPPQAEVVAGSPVEFLFRTARQLHLPAVPVTGPPADRGPGVDYLGPIRKVAQTDRRGVAIRVSYDDFRDPQDLLSAIATVQSHIEVPDLQTDLILDGKSLDGMPEDERALDTLVEIFSEAVGALDGRSFRRIVACLSSFPEKSPRTIGGAPVRIVRLEGSIWRSLVHNRSLQTTALGDYGVVFSRETDPVGPVIAPSKVRLSTPTMHVLFKGRPEDYFELAREVMQASELNEVADCWGTHSIRDCTVGAGGLGNATTWVARDTNTHIETTARTAQNILLRAKRLEETETVPTDPWLQTFLFK